MTATELLCNTCGTFTASDCPDYGSSDCPRAVPGAECCMDEQYVSELLASKRRYYERRAKRGRNRRTSQAAR